LLHRKCGGDHGTKDIAHVWRLPGTLNYPNAAKLGRGRPAEPQPVQLTGGSFAPVDPDELRRALEAMPDLHPARATDAGDAARRYTGGSTSRDEIIARLPGWLNDHIETEAEPGDRSSHCYNVMQSLFEHGLTDNEIRIVADSAPFAAKYASRGDLDAEIARARTKWEENGGKRANGSKTARLRAAKQIIPWISRRGPSWRVRPHMASLVKSRVSRLPTVRLIPSQSSPPR
jgi:hypothetical protein